jgi:hypothetical protein
MQKEIAGNNASIHMGLDNVESPSVSLLRGTGWSQKIVLPWSGIGRGKQPSRTRKSRQDSFEEIEGDMEIAAYGTH